MQGNIGYVFTAKELRLMADCLMLELPGEMEIPPLEEEGEKRLRLLDGLCEDGVCLRDEKQLLIDNAIAFLLKQARKPHGRLLACDESRKAVLIDAEKLALVFLNSRGDRWQICPFPTLAEAMDHLEDTLENAQVVKAWGSLESAPLNIPFGEWRFVREQLLPPDTPKEE